MPTITTVPNNLSTAMPMKTISISYKDLQATSGSGAKTISTGFTIPAGGKILGVYQKTKTVFAGGSLSALTCSVGKSGTATHFTATYDVMAAVTDTNVQETALFKSGQASALAVTAHLTPTGDNCSAATAGEVEITILYTAPTLG